MNLSRTIRYGALMLVIGWILCFPGMTDACPTCKNALHGNGAATGYAISILFMMIMPFAIFSFWAVLILRLRRDGAESSADFAPDPNPESLT